MDTRLIVAILAIAIATTTTMPVRADTGIGLFTSTNAETIMEGATMCVTYKIYNPFDTDIYGALAAEGNLLNVTTYVDPSVFVPKGTFHKAGIDRRICFGVEDIHSDCLIGRAFCRTCSEKTYDGSVVAYTAPSPGTGGSGSSTSAASGQPFRLTVVCNPNHFMPFRYLIYAAGVIVLAGAAWWAKRNIRIDIGLKKKEEGKKEPLQRIVKPPVRSSRRKRPPIRKKRRIGRQGRRKKNNK